MLNSYFWILVIINRNFHRLHDHECFYCGFRVDLCAGDKRKNTGRNPVVLQMNLCSLVIFFNSFIHCCCCCSNWCCCSLSYSFSESSIFVCTRNICKFPSILVHVQILNYPPIIMNEAAYYTLCFFNFHFHFSVLVITMELYFLFSLYHFAPSRKMVPFLLFFFFFFLFSLKFQTDCHMV